MMPRGAMPVNVGRGKHVVDEDLIKALDSGHLSYATLDALWPHDLDGVSRKFLASATLVVPRDQAERIRDAVLTLEEHTAAHLASLLRSEAPSHGSEKRS
jgi:glyoxylate/hydroxypyruvate reductase